MGGSSPGGAGGSGIIVLSVPTGTPMAFSGGVARTSTTVGSNTAWRITAAGPSDTVTIG
jgi:hypothetical protein